MTENENTTITPETGEDDRLLELERLNTALQTTENSLAAFQAESKRSEAEILDLRQRLANSDKEKLAAEVDRDQKVTSLDAKRVKAEAEKRRAVERGQAQQTELDTLRRANKELERRCEGLTKTQTSHEVVVDES